MERHLPRIRIRIVCVRILSLVFVFRRVVGLGVGPPSLPPRPDFPRSSCPLCIPIDPPSSVDVPPPPSTTRPLLLHWSSDPDPDPLRGAMGAEFVFGSGRRLGPHPEPDLALAAETSRSSRIRHARHLPNAPTNTEDGEHAHKVRASFH